MRRVKALTGGAAAALVFLLASCGGGSDIGSGGPTPTASNVLSVAVTSGPNQTSANTLFTSVTICVPGSTTQCQTIDNIQVDTGSYGLRILASALNLALPIQKASDGNSLGECTQFVDGYSWGPVAAADLTLSGETAGSLPVQVIGDSSFAAAPSTCTSTGTEEDDVTTFGANGILGIGVFAEDCGSGCAPIPNTAPPAGYYYSCTASACTPIAVPVSSQVLNPVSQFMTDNNGTIIELPSVAAGGASGVTGSLIFGIDTQANNASGNQVVLQVDPNQGYFTTLFDGQTLTKSFIDSGSNGIYFNDSNITQCTKTGFSGFYCPTSNVMLTAELTGTNAVSTTVSFTIGDAETFSGTATALPTLGGSYPGSTDGFDLGLNFFYGRSVYNAIENQGTKVGTGPYVAF